MGTILGLDVGTKTIGVAAAQEGVGVVSPRLTLARKGLKTDIPAVLAQADDIAFFVVGVAFNEDGSEGRSAKLARQVGAKLADAGHRVEYMDESFSSMEAEERLRNAGHSARRIKELVDQVAAAVILEDWLAEQ